MTDMNEVILKADRRGRLRYTAEQKQVLVEAYEASGLSGPRFAALHGVHYQTLVSWLKKHRQGDSDHPLLPRQPSGPTGQEVHVCDGVSPYDYAMETGLERVFRPLGESRPVCGLHGDHR